MLKLGEIIGQDTAIKVLKSAAAGKTGHAYLFTGPDGVGKKTAAFAWARAVMCREDEEEACGRCVPCRKIEAGSHPDLIYLKPEARDKKVKEEIDITHIREVIRRFSFKPYEAAKKILIVDGADRMNLSAANAFLKTLEEPQGDALIIIVASNASRLPLTIISRCQRVRFHKLKKDEMLEFARSRLDISEAEAVKLAAMSKGSPGRALSGDIEDELEIRDAAMALISDAKEFGMDRAYKLARTLDRGKERGRVDRLLESAQEIVRDLLAVKIKGKCDNLINTDIESVLVDTASRYSRRRLFRAFEVIQGLGMARQWNINPFLIVSLLALELRE